MTEKFDRNGRLLEIAALMDLLDENDGATSYDGNVVNFDIKTWARKNHCGTSACAIGHAILAGLIPEIMLVKINGAEFTPSILWAEDVALRMRREHTTLLHEVQHEPCEFAGASERAIAAALRIRVKDVRSLFYNGGYSDSDRTDPEGVVVNVPQPRHIARKIRRWVQAHPA